MARIRTLKPDAFSSESLCAIPRAARWTFAGLLTYVDDAGRGRADARLIKAHVYALDDDVTADDVEAELAMLEKVDTIRRYEVGGKRYLYFPNWEHQRISHPSPSKLPEPPEDTLPTPPEELQKPLEGSGENLEASASRAGARSTSTSLSTSVSPSSSETRARENDHGSESSRAAVLATVTDELVAEYANAMPRSLPRKVRQQLYDQVDGLLGEGFARDEVREGLIRLSRRQNAAPGLLPHLVHDVTRGAPATQNGRPETRAQQTDRVLAEAEAAVAAGRELPRPGEHTSPYLRVIEGQTA